MINKQLLHFLKPYKLRILAVILALIVTASVTLALGQGLRILIDKGFATGDHAWFAKSLLFIITLGISLAIASFFRSYLIESVCQKVIKNIREEIYNKLLSMSISFYETAKINDYLSRITNDLSTMSTIIVNSLSFMLRNLIMFVGGIILLLIINYKLTLIMLSFILITLIPIIMVGKKLRLLSKENQNSLALISDNLQETLYGIKIIFSYNLADYKKQQFDLLNEQNLYLHLKKTRTKSFLISSVMVIIFSIMTLILWLGSSDLIGERISLGNLTAFIFYSILVATSLGGLVEVATEIQKAKGAGDRIVEILDLKPQIIDGNVTELDKKQNEIIKIENLSFHYPSNPDKNVISNLNLSINKGEKIAIIGPSGSGKTTIFNLLLRFYEAEQGNIYIYGQEIRSIKLKYLRSLFSLVLQDDVIFSDSIRNNILMGNLNADESQILEASSKAEIDDFIQTLPNKYEQFVGERGLRISGGQKQRIAIARAILKNADICLFDEATSNLDTENEQLVKNNIYEYLQGKTIITIAHRLSTILDADKIILLNNGKIESIGTHKELSEKSELYKKLIKSQYQN